MKTSIIAAAVLAISTNASAGFFDELKKAAEQMDTQIKQQQQAPTHNYTPISEFNSDPDFQDAVYTVLSADFTAVVDDPTHGIVICETDLQDNLIDNCYTRDGVMREYEQALQAEAAEEEARNARRNERDALLSQMRCDFEDGSVSEGKDALNFYKMAAITQFNGIDMGPFYRHRAAGNVYEVAVHEDEFKIKITIPAMQSVVIGTCAGMDLAEVPVL